MAPDMRVGGATPVASPHPEPPASSALRERYRAYRLRQGRELLNLVPREGLRALVEACRAERPGAEASLEALASWCADRLPLPPLRTWMADFQQNRDAHFADSAPGETGPRSPDGTPVVVAVRHFQHQAIPWVAQLHVRPRNERWEGSIQFHGESDRAWRTAAVFRESSVPAILERFRSFDDPTLSAFLRSSLP